MVFVRRFACLVCGLLAASGSAHAGYFFNVQGGTFSNDGATKSVNVFVTSNNPAVDFPIAVNGYQASLQATGLVGISSVTFLPASTAPTPLFASTPTTVSAAGPLVVSSNLGDSATLTATTNLFRLNFAVPAGQTGTFSLSFLDSTQFASELNTTVGGADLINNTTVGSSITIVAVPEPTSLILLGIGGVGFALVRRRRTQAKVVNC
jgi:hypothetical protein